MALEYGLGLFNEVSGLGDVPASGGKTSLLLVVTLRCAVILLGRELCRIRVALTRVSGLGAYWTSGARSIARTASSRPRVIRVVVRNSARNSATWVSRLASLVSIRCNRSVSSAPAAACFACSSVTFGIWRSTW